MATFFESGYRIGFRNLCFYVGVSRLPRDDGRIALLKDLVVIEESGAFNVDYDSAARVLRADPTSHQQSKLIRKDWLAAFVNYSDAVTVSVNANPKVGAAGARGFADAVEECKVFRVGIITGERPVGSAIQLDDLTAERPQDCWSEPARGSIAGGKDDL
jgi:hypothetical protein